ncbi:hypothetical protein [Shouchella lehensis]|uniref:hypothetical protein n=1 Tax=Shouchella lehensis TaxID=300825 RepID=UPI001419F3B6|nr:hypothetical protein [Shouchella lehensis]
MMYQIRLSAYATVDVWVHEGSVNMSVIDREGCTLGSRELSGSELEGLQMIISSVAKG